MSTSKPLMERLTGKWHLLDFAADELQIPQHRMDLAFDATGSCLKGAILSRIDAKETALAVIEFEGATHHRRHQAPGRDGIGNMLLLAQAAQQWHAADGAKGAPRLMPDVSRA